MKKSGVDCNLCPVHLFKEKNKNRIVEMFHDGTCLMDERNPANLGAISKAKQTGRRQYARPVNLSDSQIKKR